MRKSKVFEVLAAAAVASVPGLSFAEDFYPPGGEVREWTPAVQAPNDYTTGAGKFRFANPIPGLGGGPDADVDGTFLAGFEHFINNPTADGVSWHNPANWTTNPQIPDGNAAIARFDGRSGGASVTLGGTNATVSQLHMNDPQLSAIGGAQLTLAGPATVHADPTFFNPPGVIFSGINVLGTATTSINIAGTNGLTKTGAGFVQLGTANTFSGPVNINGGVLLVTGDDAALGNASNPINLNNGTLDIRTAGLNTSRTINVGAGGGTVFYAGGGRTFATTGDITGSSTFTVNGGFGAPDAATFSTAKSFSGVLRVGAGTLNVSDAGAVANASSVIGSGTVILRQGAAGASVNRIGDATPVTLDGGVLRVEGNNVAYTETMGALNLDNGTSWLQVNPGGGGAVLQFSSANRLNRSSAAFRGENLGGSGGGTTQIRFTAAPTLVGGLIPWAYGNAGNTLFTTPESEGNVLVTYGANGVTPITTYVDLASSNANTNALVSDTGGSVSAGNTINANALVLRVSDFYVGNPMTLDGTGTINLTTGVILSGNAGFDSSGTAINSSPGNIVNANINAGANELIIHTPSAVTFNGVLAGSGGMTKTGGRTGFFNADNTYTGETNLGGFVRFNRNVGNGVPSPFGNSTTPVVLWSGNFAPVNPGTNAANGTMAGILAADNNSGALTFARPLSIKGSGTNLIRNFSDGALTFTGNINIDAGSQLLFQGFGAAAGGSDQMIVTSVISGGGGVQARNIAQGGAVPGAMLRLTAANTFTGGFDGGGRIEVGNNQALGAGSVTQSNATEYVAFGAARTVANPLFVVAGELGFAGSDAFTWSGPITFVGGDNVLRSDATVPVTLSGPIINGGGFFKTGSGTVVVSGNNTFNGTLNVGNGTIEGGMVVLASNNAAGTTVGNSGVNAGQNALGLQGNITIPDEIVFLRGNGIGDQGALRNLSGNNTWGGRVQAGLPNTIGIDSGQLTIGRSWFSVGTGTNAGTAVATKVGPGTLVVTSEQFTAGTSNFQGSIIADRLDINGGVVQIAPSGGGSKRVADVLGLNMAAGTQLDLTDNALVVDYASGGPSPLADIRSKIVSGFAGGAWTGPGIMSSAANANQFGVGYVENNGSASGTSYTTFLGDPVDNSAILVRHTRYGDADVNGLVNLGDFNRLAANFGLAAGAVWGQGDFDYNGIVNLADFNRLAANFGLSAGPDGPTPDDWANLAAAIPEPSALGLAAVAGLSLLNRRRRAAR